MTLKIKAFFDEDTATFSYILANGNKAAIIDPVLNYDQFAARSSTKSADQIIAYVSEHKLDVAWILETHAHVDHLTAAQYLKTQLGGNIGIGSCITKVLEFWVPIFNTYDDTPLDGSQFDSLFEDNETINLGNLEIKVLHTPGHTPACVSYLIEDAIFVGDTIFMPDVGTTRADFPGGSPEMLYNSINLILSLPNETKIFTCHDYPPSSRKPEYLSTVAQQKEQNILLNSDISKSKYIEIRNQRDKDKPVPKLLLPAIQFNLRSGSFGKFKQGKQFIKIPVNKL